MAILSFSATMSSSSLSSSVFFLAGLFTTVISGSATGSAACGAIFIWINSLSGLIARFQYHAIDVVEFLPLVVAVLLGGSLGSYMGSSKLKPRTMEKWLGGVILITIVFLIKKIVA